MELSGAIKGKSFVPLAELSVLSMKMEKISINQKLSFPIQWVLINHDPTKKFSPWYTKAGSGILGWHQRNCN
jgi:hypothetical protein